MIIAILTGRHLGMKGLSCEWKWTGWNEKEYAKYVF